MLAPTRQLFHRYDVVIHVEESLDHEKVAERNRRHGKEGIDFGSCDLSIIQ